MHPLCHAASSWCRFLETVVKSFEDGGAFAPESVVLQTQRVHVLNEHVIKVWEQEAQLIGRLRHQQVQASDLELDAVRGSLPPHREDLRVLEAMSTCMHATCRYSSAHGMIGHMLAA
jgi:hypothetical protein